MKLLSILLLIFKITNSFSTPTVLTQGDLAIIGFNFANPDEFSFITFVDLEEGTIIYFTDCGWENTHAFKSGEGLITYSVPTGGKKSFDVITYPNDPGFTTAGVSGFFGFALSGDQILAFQGSFDAPSFIFALNNYQSSWQDNADDSHSSALPDNLIDGTTAIAVNQGYNGIYNCVEGSSKDKSVILQSITDPSNWIITSDRTTLPGTCFQGSLTVVFQSFSITIEENFYKASIVLTSEAGWIVSLEESDDGKVFIENTSRVTNNGNNTFEFKSYASKKYCRIKAEKSGDVTLYSEIKTIESQEEIPDELLVYNINGILVYSCTRCNTYNKDLFKNQSPLFVKKQFKDGSIKVEKIISIE